MLFGCSAAPELSCATFGPEEGTASPNDMLLFPDQIVKVAAELRLELAGNEKLAGMPGTSMAKFPETDARSFLVELTGLRRLVAYQVALEQAVRNDGVPLVNVADEKSCAMLADSVASLDQGQSAEQLGSNLGRVEERFGPDYPFRIERIGQ